MTVSIPVGGTTGLSHEHSAAVEEAVRWLAEQPAGTVHPAVLEIVSRFGVSISQACEVVALADKMRLLRRAFG